MSIILDPATGIVAPALDLVTPLPVSEGGTGATDIQPYKMVLGTAQSTTSGTSIDFTGIPSWVKRITFMLNGVSTNGTSVLALRIGTSSGLETTGYDMTVSELGAVSVNSGSDANAGHWNIQYGWTSTLFATGALYITKSNTNTWNITGSVSRSGVSNSTVITGSKTLSGTLDRIRLTTVNGIDTFDAGSVNIMYEGY